MKTIKQWFESVADEELRQQLLDRMDQLLVDSYDISLSMAIRRSFTWPVDEALYWEDICNQADEGKIKML